MARVLVQATKEWAAFRRDRLSVALAVLLPLATLLLFGYGVRLENKNIPVIVRDADRSLTSRKLTDILLSSSIVRAVKDQAGGTIDRLRRGDAKASIEIPAHFESKLKAGESAQFQAILDGSDVSSAETLRALVSFAGFQTERQILTPDTQSLFVVPNLEIRFNSDASEAPFIVTGVFAIVLWMYPALLAAVAISRELEQETIIQVYASGLKGVEFLIGKGAVYCVVGVGLAVMMMTLSHYLFGLSLAGDPTSLIASTLVYVIAAVSFGLFAGVMTREENAAVQATATGGFFPALLLSGFVYPLANIPFPLSLVTFIVPARYYIDICRDAFMRGIGWYGMWWRVVLLTFFALVFFAGAWNGIRKMQMDE